MSAYPPPIENVPIFDPLLFQDETSGGSLTQTISANTTNFTQNGSVSYNNFGQITAATNGVIPGFAGGIFTNPNLTVNTYGQITAITNGSGGTNVLSTQIFTLSSNITFPAGTQFATIMLVGAGGPSGSAYYDGVGTTTAGGAGGAGGVAIFTRIPMEASTSMSCTIVGGEATLYYLPVPNTVLSSTSAEVGIAYPGGAGINASALVPNPAGGGGGSFEIILLFPYGCNGTSGGAGQATSGTFLVPRSVNYLSTFNQNLSSPVNPFHYGAGGYSNITNGAAGNVQVEPAGSACCLVISYSS
jgi:hypothetical protein